MSNFLWPIFGGVLIGLSATLLLLFSGRLAGISGIVWGAINPKKSGDTDTLWRWLFIAGILLGAFLFHLLTGKPAPEANVNYPLAAIAGLLVGMGVKIGNGCTSGHGVCGIGRLSTRSLAATITFMTVAIITVAIFNIVFGAGVGL